MAEEVTLYSAIDQVSDALERVLVDNVANLERYVSMETDPLKQTKMCEVIVDTMNKLQALKERRDCNKKQSSAGVFEKVMSQLGNTPKIVSKLERHNNLKSIMSQIEEAKINNDEQDDSIQGYQSKQLDN